jgi:hypothetical protein
LRNQTPLERQFLAIDRDSRRHALPGLFINSLGEYLPDKTPEKIDWKFTPESSILYAIENLFSDQLQQRMRSSEVKERVALAFSDKIRATPN